MVPEPETLHELEAHRRELKAQYDIIQSCIRALENMSIPIGIELQRWDRKVERARQETAIEEEHRLILLRAETSVVAS